MDLSGWSASSVDKTRLKRLGVGYAMGAIAIAGLITAFEVSASEQPNEPEDPGLDVELVESPEPEPAEDPTPQPDEPPPPAAAEPPPTQQPPPTPQPQTQRLPAGPALRTIQAPDSIPKGDVQEAEPSAETDAVDPYGDPEAQTGGTGTERAAAPAPAPAPKPPPKPKPKPRRKAAPKRLTEDMTPPRALSTPQPSYPESLRSQGIEGTVIVRFIITAAGNTTNVRAVRGPAALRAACVAAVQRWRFKPAQDANGNPVPLSKTMRFPFRLKTRR